MTGYFEVISASAQHIYHSALVFVPQESIVRKLYESYAHPFTRVVHGLPMSWDATTAAITRSSARIEAVAWSPCNSFIAISFYSDIRIEILDSVTLQRLQTLEFLQAWEKPAQHEALVFSPDSHVLTSFSRRDFSKERLVISWDLQTGGLAGVIGLGWMETSRASIAYSANGKFVAVHCRNSFADDIFDDTAGDTILILDVTSSVHIHSHLFASTVEFLNDIWTHEESLQFATFDVTAITIWEVGFASDAAPTEVETLPVAGNAEFAACYAESSEEDRCECFRFLPSPCRLAIIFQDEDKVAVWDVRKSKFLLYCTDSTFYSMSFSSDGHFFACSTLSSDIYLWKESPAGYILHQILAPNTAYPSPLLSRNGESIIVFSRSTIRLWRTKSFTTSPSSGSTRTPYNRNFVLDFSPDGMSTVVARQENNSVEVLNLKSGVLQSTIDAGMEVYGSQGGWDYRYCRR